MDGDVPTIPPRIAGEDTLGENRMWLGKGPRGGGAAISGTNVLVLLLEISTGTGMSSESGRIPRAPAGSSCSAPGESLGCWG